MEIENNQYFSKKLINKTNKKYKKENQFKK